MADAVNTADAVAKDGGKPTVVGNPDNWQLLTKFVSTDKTLIVSTKAMEVAGVGCIVSTYRKECGVVTEVPVWCPGVRVVEDVNGGKKLATSLDYDALAYGFHILDNTDDKSFLNEAQKKRIQDAFVVAQAIRPRWGE